MSSKMCQHIAMVVDICRDDENHVKNLSHGWTNADVVVHMIEPLSSEVKNIVEGDVESLEYWLESSDSHYEPSEGYYCSKCKSGISFPLHK